MGFETRECTSYVAWRLNHDDRIGFTTHYRGVLWWNAAEWLRAALAAGIPAAGDSAPGSVMVLQPGVSGAGAAGHVEVVVRAIQGWVLVDEYNANDAGRFGRGLDPGGAVSRDGVPALPAPAGDGKCPGQPVRSSGKAGLRRSVLAPLAIGESTDASSP